MFRVGKNFHRLRLFFAFTDRQREKARLKKRRQRARMSPEQKKQRNSIDAQRKRDARDEASPVKKKQRNSVDAQRKRDARDEASPEKKRQRNSVNARRMRVARDKASPEKKRQRNFVDALRKANERRNKDVRPAMAKAKTKSMKEAIEHAEKKAKQALHRTQDENDGSMHKTHVCVICDCFILGTDSIRYLRGNDIKQHKHRIGVESYEKYYKTKLDKELVKQYHVPNMPGLLLSPRSRKIDKGYETCLACCEGMQRNHIIKETPPKFAIANGFVIGSFPEIFSYIDKDGNEVRTEINVEEDVNDVLRAFLAPIRPYGFVTAFSGGSHRSVHGHYQYFEMDQAHVGGVMNHLDPTGAGRNIYAVICGRMTTSQREIARNRAKIDTSLYTSLLSWFIQKSGHSGYKNVVVPNEIPQPKLVEDKQGDNNTDKAVNAKLENQYGGGTYYFSSAQDPTEKTACYDTSSDFTLAMVNRTAPTLLAVGGSYAKAHEMGVENVIPFAFPWGIGGPNMKRRTPVSVEACIQRLFRTAMAQLMRGDVILILSHIYHRQLAYKSGVMTSRGNKVNGITLAERLAKMTVDDFKSDAPSAKFDELMAGVSTSCKSLGHSPESAKFARRCCFALVDYFGLNSLFLTISPCDECSFRVRLYAHPNQWVSNKKFTQLVKIFPCLYIYIFSLIHISFLLSAQTT